VAAIFNAGSSGKCTAGSGAAPLITAQPASLAVPLASTANFQVSATGTSPMTYSWSKDGCALVESGNVSCAYTTALSLANVCPADEGQYTVIISNPAGCLTSSVASLKVLLPPVMTTQPQGCAQPVGSKAVFGTEATGTAPMSYRWQFNGVELANGQRFHGAYTPTLTLANVQPPNAGYYRLVVTNGAGATTSAVAALRVVLPDGKVVSPNAPNLSIAWSEGQVLLSWPAESGPGFQLQSRTLGAGVWLSVTNEPTYTNGCYQVGLPTVGAATFYRLQ
jgi:hypothetical protein